MESKTTQNQASYKKTVAAKALLITAIIVVCGSVGAVAFQYRANLPFKDSIKSGLQAAVTLYSGIIRNNTTSTETADEVNNGTATTSDAANDTAGLAGNSTTSPESLTKTDKDVSASNKNSTSTTVAVSPAPSQTGTNTAATSSQTKTAGPEQKHLYSLGTTTIASGNTNTGTAPKQTDLSVKILSIGTVDKTTGVYTQTTALRASDRIAVHFSVENIGTKESGAWNFAAPLPTFPWYIFQSDYQESLKPGDRIEFTIGFDNIEKADGNVVRINVDPNNQVNEASKTNNTASTTISGVVF